MKSKIIYTFIALLTLFRIPVFAQLINMNPDPNGPVWASGDMDDSPLSSEWNSIELYPSVASQSLTLPSSVFNNDSVWFPYIYNQGNSGSCVHVAEVFYTFNYEMNRKFGRTASHILSDHTNLFNPLYTYNYLNNGYYNTFTARRSGFQIIRDCGAPDWITFDDSALYHNSTKYKYWMTDYEKYKSGMGNTVSNTIFQFSFTLDYTFLNNIRHWIFDHCNASQSGGLATIGIFTVPWVIGQIQTGTYINQKYIKKLGLPNTESGHEMTICGYDDDVKIDWGGGGTAADPQPDGQFRNDIDNNHDGVIDIRDFEIGAFKVANSWGFEWSDGNSGFIWMPYYLFYPTNSGFNGLKVAESCDVFGETGEMPQPAINLKVNMEHDHRDHIKCSAGYAPAANNNNPLAWDDLFHLTYSGGYNPMRGCYNGPIDMGIAFSHLYNPNDVGKVFFKVKESNSTGTSFQGKINSFTLVDDRWGETFELPHLQTNIPIPYGGETTLAIDYHLLPHETHITTAMTVNSNRVSRFTTTVSNQSILTVAASTNIDMYNSEIHIDAGSTFEIGQNCTITAKRGTCKLVIDGNITVGSNVYFIAEEGAELQILLNNSNLAVTFPSTHFTRCKLVSWAQDITFNAALFDHCGAVTAYRGNVNAINSTGFDNSYLLLDYLGSSNNQFMATIDHCDFVSDELMPSIFLVRYGKYLIQNDSIRGFSNGIQLFYSGGGQSGYQKIKNNNIRNSALAGVKIYTSTGEMSGTNYIHGNNFGIQLFNNCNILLAGNPDARSSSLTQKIADNSSYEFYATNCSFPAYFKYNAIIDDNNQGNPTDPLLYYDNANCQPNQVFDVAYNYWGTSFNAASDLKLNCGTFNWMPVWYPGGNPSASAVEDLYMEASSLFENGSYEQAVLLFQLLIEQYPTSSYAPAAMKELLRLESFTTNNYNNLKEYYLTDNTIANDSTLSKLGAFLANKCDVELGNWENAIAWYENQILNPTSSADSIFAIIDLGDIYLLMQNQGLKSSYVGKLAQYKPESKEQYAVNRDYLLSLLPFEKNQNKPDSDIAGNNQGFLNQNSPNPFSESTQINYSITRAGNIDISVRNLTGQEIINLPQGTKEKGSYSVGFFNQALPSGFYFFSLKIDGNVIATRKMCVSR